MKFRPEYSAVIPQTQIMPAGDPVNIADVADDYQTYLGNSNSQMLLYSRVLDPYIREIEEKVGVKMFNPGFHYAPANPAPIGGEADLYPSITRDEPVLTDIRSSDDKFSESLNDIINMIQQNEDLFAGSESDILNLTPMKLEQMVVEEANKIRDAYLYNDDRSMTTGHLMSDLAGTFYAAAKDPINIASVIAPFTLGPGLQSKMVYRLGSELALATGSEVMIQSEVEDLYKDLGLEYTDEQYWANIFAAAGGTLALGGFIETLLASPQITMAVKRKLITKIEENKGGSNISETLNAAELADDINKQTLNQNIIKDDPNDVKHVDNINKAKEAILADKVEELSFNDQYKKLDLLLHEKNDGKYSLFRTNELKVKPKMFQFKGGADSKGLLDTLEGVDEWNELLSGDIIVFETKKGEYIVADGHQRFGLAQRLVADPNYKGPDPLFTAIKMREADGFTPDFVKAVAGAKNIANKSGTAVDAARLLKVESRLLEAIIPPKSKIMQYARGLQKLHDDVLDLIDTGVVPERYAHFVGNYFSDRGQQLAVIDLLNKAKPANLIEAENIVANAKMAGFQKADQGGLFSDDMIAQSLFKERAKILSATLGGLQGNKKLLNTLVEKSNIIEQYGNKLNKLNNAQRKDLYGQIIETIKHNANNVGGIADDLAAVTKRYADGAITLAEASREFEQAVQQRIASGSFDGLQVSGARSRDGTTSPNDRQAQQTTNIDQLDKYEDGALGDKLDEEINELKTQVTDMFDDLEQTYPGIKQEKMFEMESIDGNTKEKMSVDEMSEEVDFTDAAMKELKDC